MYGNMDEAKKAKFPTELDGTPLTLAQVNHLASIYDALRGKEDVDEPMAVAIKQFKEIFEVKAGKWVQKEKVSFQDGLDVKKFELAYPEGGGKKMDKKIAEIEKARRAQVEMFALSALVASSIAENRIPNQTIVHEGEWRGGKVKITKEMIEELQKNYTKLLESKTAFLRPNVTIDHGESVNDIIGHLENVRVETLALETPKGKVEVAALVGDEVITEPDALGKIQRGTWNRRSAGFLPPDKYVDAVTNEKYGHVLLESSYVDIPELTSIPPVFQTMVAVGKSFDDAVIELRKQFESIDKGGGDPDMKEMEKLKADLKAAQEKLKNRDDEVEKLQKEAEAGGGDSKDKENLKRALDGQEKLRGEVRTLRIKDIVEQLSKRTEDGFELPPALIKMAQPVLEGCYGLDTKVTLKRRDGDKEIEKEFEIADAVVELLNEMKALGRVNMNKLTTDMKPEDKDNEKEMLEAAEGAGIELKKDGKQEEKK